MSAMNAFVEEVKPGVWELRTPPEFDPQDMIKAAVDQFRSVDSDPMQMGRSAGAYDALRMYPATLVKVMRRMQGTDGSRQS
jgi:hypothetical protein